MMVASAQSNHLTGQGMSDDTGEGIDELSLQALLQFNAGTLTPAEHVHIAEMLVQANDHLILADVLYRRAFDHIKAATSSLNDQDWTNAYEEAENADDDTDSGNAKTAEAVAQLGVAWMTFYYYAFM